MARNIEWQASLVGVTTTTTQVFPVKKSEEFTTSYNGEVCDLAEPYGILKFNLHGAKCYAFFIFSNVFAERDSITCVSPRRISVKQNYNFHLVSEILPSLAKGVRCFHAGLVWKNSKPRNIQDISHDPNTASSFLKSYLTAARKFPAVVAAVPPPVATLPKQSVQKNISGHTGIVSKALNKNEGLMVIRRGEKGGKIVWFNRSNLDKVKMKFDHVKHLVGMPFHFDAELLHAPANPDEFVWYQGTAFWDSGMLKPQIPNNVVGMKITEYHPSSEFSLKLKQGVELKSTNQFSSNAVDNIFKELSNSRMLKELNSPPKKEPADMNQLWDEVKRLNQSLTNLKLEKVSERRTSLPGLAGDEQSMNNSYISLPNEVRNEPKGMENVNLGNFNWRGNDLFYFNFPKPEVEERLGHFLNLKKTLTVPDHFIACLNFKTVFSRLLFRECKNGEAKAMGLPDTINEKDFVEINKAEKERKIEYLRKLEEKYYVKASTEESRYPPSYLLKESGFISHLSEDSKAGLIHCKYGCVYFRLEDLYDYDEEWKNEEITFIQALRPVFFDAYYEPFQPRPVHFVATCVWTEKRPDVQKLIESVADVPKKLTPGTYEGQVVKLDLPSNAIVKLKDENVGVVVTRGIFDPKRTDNIADFISIGENLEVSIQDFTVNYYAENAIRHLRFAPRENIEGYAVLTHYTDRLGIFQYRLKNSLLTGIFSKDLARDLTATPVKYIPVGSYIRIKGSMITSHKEIQIIATEIESVNILKENLSENPKYSEFVPKKRYVGNVITVRNPYACVLEAVNELGEKVNVFVQSRKLALGEFKSNLTYADQIQFHVNTEDKIAFTPEVCSDLLGLHPFKWHAARAWKIEDEVPPLETCSEGADLNPSAYSGAAVGRTINWQSIGPIKKEDARSNYSLSPVNYVPPGKRDEDVIITALKNSIRDEAVMPDSLFNKIVDNFSKRLAKDSLVDTKKNKTRKTREKSTQTVSTGKVIYLKIHP